MNVIVDYNERRNQVLVIESGDVLTLFDAESISGETALEITDWVDQLELGRRVAYDIWQLKDRRAVELFVLRWQ